MKPCEHKWKRVPPVVVTLGNGPGKSYNAQCERCGEREWVHWPTP